MAKDQAQSEIFEVVGGSPQEACNACVVFPLVISDNRPATTDSKENRVVLCTDKLINEMIGDLQYILL